VKGSTDKFYEINRIGSTVKLRYGRRGTEGVCSDKIFATDTEAMKFSEKTAREKRSKGYSDKSNAINNTAENFEVEAKNIEKEVKEIANSSFQEDLDEVEKMELEQALLESTKYNQNSNDNNLNFIENNSKNVNLIIDSTSVEKEVVQSIVYLEFVDVSSNKFYEIKRVGTLVYSRYGRCGSDGVTINKSFKNFEEAVKFCDKTIREKKSKGYIEISNHQTTTTSTIQATTSKQQTTRTASTTTARNSTNTNTTDAVEPSGDLSKDLENGLKVFVKGSSALPYTLSKFNGGYKCTCQGVFFISFFLFMLIITLLLLLLLLLLILLFLSYN
jgi:predicted DNA-binding WGR domain protein